MEQAPKGPTPSQLQVNDPELFAYLKQKVKNEAQKLIVKGETLTEHSLQAIAHMTALNAERMGKPLTKESIDALGMDLQDTIINSTTVRVDHDNEPGKTLMIDVEDKVIGSAQTTKGIQEMAAEENRRDVQ